MDVWKQCEVYSFVTDGEKRQIMSMQKNINLPLN